MSLRLAVFYFTIVLRPPGLVIGPCYHSGGHLSLEIFQSTIAGGPEVLATGFRSDSKVSTVVGWLAA